MTDLGLDTRGPRGPMTARDRALLFALLGGDHSLLPLLYMVYTHPMGGFLLQDLLHRGLVGAELKAKVERDHGGDVRAFVRALASFAENKLRA